MKNSLKISISSMIVAAIASLASAAHNHNQRHLHPEHTLSAHVDTHGASAHGLKHGYHADTHGRVHS